MIGTFTCATASQFVLTNNILLFDRTNKSKPAGFYVQAGVTYTGAGLWQVYAGNDYWNTSETFSTDPKAFSSQSAGCKSRTYYTLAGWQGLGEDAGSVSVSPGFTNATYPADDYSFANGNSPIPGFVPFCLVGPGTACPGRLSGNAVAAVLGTFQTLPFNPATDY